MSATCRFGCGAPVEARGCCSRHYGKLLRTGRLRAGLIDPGPVRARITEHLARGRTIHDLADSAGLDATGLRDIHAGRRARVRVGTADAVMRVPLPPTQVGTLRRLRALAWAGWRRVDIADAAGVPALTIGSAVRRGVFTAPVMVAVDRAFRVLRGGRGPSARVAHQAVVAGWCSAVAWDDIDDPGECPAPVWSRPRGGVDLSEVAWLMEGGSSLDHVASRLGVTVKTIREAQRRAGRESA